jgi:hypothetical protein
MPGRLTHDHRAERDIQDGAKPECGSALPALSETQQTICDVGGLRSFYPTVRERPGRKPLREIKLMQDDPVAIADQSEDIKARYVRLFRV